MLSPRVALAHESSCSRDPRTVLSFFCLLHCLECVAPSPPAAWLEPSRWCGLFPTPPRPPTRALRILGFSRRAGTCHSGFRCSGSRDTAAPIPPRDLLVLLSASVALSFASWSVFLRVLSLISFFLLWSSAPHSLRGISLCSTRGQCQGALLLIGRAPHGHSSGVWASAEATQARNEGLGQGRGREVTRPPVGRGRSLLRIAASLIQCV